MQHRFYSKAQCAQLRKVNMPADTFPYRISRSNWGRKGAPVYIWSTSSLSCIMSCLDPWQWAQLLPLYNKGVEKTTHWGVSWSVLLTKYYSGDQIKKNKMGRACSMYGGEERCIKGFGGEI